VIEAIWVSVSPTDPELALHKSRKPVVRSPSRLPTRAIKITWFNVLKKLARVDVKRGRQRR